MPRLPIALDEELSWLGQYGEPHPTLGLDQWDAFAKPLPAAMAIDLAARQNVSLPAGFRRFMTSPELEVMRTIVH